MRARCLAVVLGLNGGCGTGDWCLRFNLECGVEAPYEILEGEDLDRDGWVSPEDCDDRDPEIYPGAVDACDGIDNNCDGQVDELTGPLQDWWKDSDLDGYGDPAEHRLDCVEAYRWVQNDQDCDDTDAGVHPGRPERCDTIDHNCDGDPSAGAAGAGSGEITLYADADGDLHGDPDVTTLGCDGQVEGFVNNSWDCDDTNPDIHLYADEYCDEVDWDCNGTPWDNDAVDAPTWYYDRDRDGYGTTDTVHVSCFQPPGWSAEADDCDDTNGDSYPGAQECRDREDNDCDGLIDEGSLLEPVIWYFDEDKDGYGAAEGPSIERCLVPYEYCDNTLDCDDLDGANFPGNDEVCDGGDNDCDELVDDEDDSLDTSTWLTWYTDGDGDGYGDPAADTSESCAPAEGFAGSADDCDDADEERYPGAPEVCGDGVLQACEEDVAAAELECSFLLATSVSEAAWTAEGAVLGGELGRTVDARGDLDGDGLPDLVVGALSADGISEEGAVYLFNRPSSGTVGLGDAFASVSSDTIAQHLGAALNASSDLDGDGFVDLVLGGPGAVPDVVGGVWIFLGPLSGPYSEADADQWLTVTGEGILAGGALDLGDLDGDGEVELLVGARFFGEAAGGGAFVVNGPMTVGDALEDCCPVISGEGRLGGAVAALGDLDGDGVGDFALGEPVLDPGAVTDAGAVRIFAGPVTTDLDTDSALVSILGVASLEKFGLVVHGPGDVSGDGLADLAVGSDRDSRPFNLFVGLSAGDFYSSDATSWGTTSTTSGGVAALDSGDLDGDGTVDFVLGAPEWHGSSSYQVGAALVLLGPLTGSVKLDSEPEAELAGSGLSWNTGASVSVAHDLDGTGVAGLLVGSPGAEVDGVGTSAGVASLFWEQGY